MTRYVNICGIPHKIIESTDNFNMDLHFGQIDYGKCEILLNTSLPEELKKETLCHEIVHGMLMHIGRQDLGDDEQFVQSLGNAIYQTFNVKETFCE